LFKPSREPKKDFKILGVNNKIGLFDAYIEKGKNIKQVYQKVEQTWLAYNPYRVNVGSIGLKTDKHEYEWISNAYVVFSCQQEKLLPEYLYKVFISDIFNQQIKDWTAGSVRQNLTFDILTGLEIPLPTKDIQIQLVNEYEITLQQAYQDEQQANQLEKEIESYLLNELGIEIKQNAPRAKNKLHFVDFKEVKRWDVDYLENQHILNEIVGMSKYKIVNFGSVVEYSQYGISEKASANKIGIPMLRMNNIVNGELDISNLKYLVTNGKDISNIVLQKNDFLFNRTNSKELVGKTAIFNQDGDYLFASYLIRLKLDKEKVNIEYINILFNSPVIRTQIDMISRRILGQANINSTELSNFLIPLPSLDIQTQIVNQINIQKSEIKKLRLQAKTLREQAKNNFETAIFE
jgi:type I restriction enzyme S subunit